jgi:hypothetical protein
LLDSLPYTLKSDVLRARILHSSLTEKSRRVGDGCTANIGATTYPSSVESQNDDARKAFYCQTDNSVCYSGPVNSPCQVLLTTLEACEPTRLRSSEAGCRGAVTKSSGNEVSRGIHALIRESLATSEKSAKVLNGTMWISTVRASALPTFYKFLHRVKGADLGSKSLLTLRAARRNVFPLRIGWSRGIHEIARQALTPVEVLMTSFHSAETVEKLLD